MLLVGFDQQFLREQLIVRRYAVDDLERRFDDLMARNFVAFDVSNHPGRIITAFDPDAREIIISPRFAGG